jgi:CRISPR-associated protein Cmr6
MNNPGFIFYKKYFGNLEFNPGDIGEFVPKLKERETRTLIEDLFKSNLADYYPPAIDIAEDCFELTTIYPGILIGSGYNHEIGDQKNELKLGFFFDYTTGLPCIPGSSVKGVLRDACEKVNGLYAKSILEELKNGERKSELKDDAKNSISEDLLKLFEGGKNSGFVNQIFEGKKNQHEFYSFKERDIFFDAFPLESKNDNGKFLANDYITPHKHPKNPKLDPFTDPNPIQFLKVLPQVTFRFYFRLFNNCMPPKIKLELFRQIFLDLGCGAKTNVGYGHFRE